MKKYVVYLPLTLIIVFGFVLISTRQALPTIKYFPIDPNVSFNYAKTSLTLSEEKDLFEVIWDSQSKTDQQLYLRQDVSLLYKNGKLNQIKSKWKENSVEINLGATIKGKKNSYLEAISFHHGEIHQNQNDIKSVHQMSDDQLYITKMDNNSTFISFKKSNNDVVKKLDKQIKQELLIQWHDAINHFQINIDQYKMVPLTNLKQVYESGTLPLAEHYATQIIGQLWEGLYKNYILPTIDQNKASYVPVILFAHDETHLLVLITINQTHTKLVQSYPVN